MLEEELGMIQERPEEVLGGALCVAGASDRVVKVLRITGLMRVMPAFPGLQEAFAWLDEARAARPATAARRSGEPGP